MKGVRGEGIQIEREKEGERGEREGEMWEGGGEERREKDIYTDIYIYI